MANNDIRHIDLFAAARSSEPLKTDLASDFFKELDQEEILGGSLHVEITVAEKAGDYFKLCYAIAGAVKVTCDRCLEEVVYDVDVKDEALVYYGEGEPSNDEARILPPRTNIYDTSWDIYEMVELALPIQRLHPDGECNPEMLQHLTALELSDDNDE